MASRPFSSIRWRRASNLCWYSPKLKYWYLGFLMDSYLSVNRQGVTDLIH